jgi:hypothetical protein
MASRVRSLAAGYPVLAAVLAAAVFGLPVQPPLAWLAKPTDGPPERDVERGGFACQN